MGKTGKSKRKRLADPATSFERSILYFRDQHVVIDRDLAGFYGVTTKQLNQAVKRNPEKFPLDFMFPLTKEERNELVATCAHLETVKFSSVMPKAFTEHGILMAASVLNSEQANTVCVALIRSFIRLRELTFSARQTGVLSNANQRGKLPAPRQQDAFRRRMDQFLASLTPKIEQAIGTVLDSVIDKNHGTTVRQEAESLLTESLGHLQARLKKAGMQNEEIAARVTKMLAQAATEREIAEKTRQEARKTGAEADQMELVTLTKKMRFVLAAQRFLTSGSEGDFLTQRVDTLIETLEELSQ